MVGHATAWKFVYESLGLGVVVIDQRWPFQCSASGLVRSLFGQKEPTAKQLFCAGHTTRSSSIFVPFGFGVVRIDHLVPFQCSVNALPARRPTAEQLAALGHATPSNSVAGDAVGLATVDHALPFHRSINWVVCRAASCELPTAKHFDGPVHATPASTAATELAGFGAR